jgi:hypothetical protein
LGSITQICQAIAIEFGHQVLRVRFLLVGVPEVAFGFCWCWEAVSEDVPFGKARDFARMLVDSFEVKGVWVCVFGFDEALAADSAAFGSVVTRVHGVPEGFVVFECQGGDFEEARHVCVFGWDGNETHVGCDVSLNKMIGLCLI